MNHHISARKILMAVYVCEICDKETDTNYISLEEHTKTVHPDKDGIYYKLYFDNVILIPGAGHMDINMLRALLSLCQPIYLEYLVGLLGFCSQKANESINGGDHHSNWQIFQIMYHALALEIIRIFYLQCFGK